MKIKLSLAAAIVASFAGSACAQTSDADMQGMMKPFYTDEEMKTMRSDEEVRTLAQGMSAEDMEAVRGACTNNPNQSYKGFCDNVMRAMGDR